MNVFTPATTPPGVKLGELNPIELGQLSIRPRALEIVGSGQTQTLEPRCMKVLVVLCEHEGDTVSRDTLIDRCWEGRIVTDGALNRCVAQVRKALSLDPALSVDTVSRVGYRLRQSVPADGPRVHDVVTTMVGKPPLGRANRRKWLPWAAGGIGLVGFVALLGVMERPWRGEAVRPLTPEPGVESYPALDPKGTRLAYGKLGASGNWDIFIRDISGPGVRPVAQSAATEIWPTWRGDGQALAYVRTLGSACEIVTFDFVSNAETVATTCDAARVGRPAWHGETALIYSDGSRAADRRQLYRLDLVSGHKTALTAPGLLHQGDMDPTLSPDGRQLAFRRTLSWGVDHLMIAPLNPDGTLLPVRSLTTDGWKAHGIAWSSDSRDIIFSSNRGGDWGLWSVKASGGVPRRIGLGTSAITKIAAGPNDLLAIETYHPRSDLKWLGDSQTPYAVMADVWTPALGPNRAVAYISNETGRAELWVFAGGQRKRLTQLGASYLHSAAWAPSGESITFVAVKDRSPQIFAVPASGGTPVQLTHNDGDKRDLAYVGADRLVYLGRSAHDGQIVAAKAGTAGFAPQTALGDRWAGLSSGNGVVVGHRTDDTHLFRIDAQGGAIIATKTAIVRPDGPYGVARDGIVVFTQGAIRKVRWDGSSVELAAWPSGRMGPADIKVNAGGQVLVIDRSENQSDISLMSLRRSLLPW